MVFRIDVDPHGLDPQTSTHQALWNYVELRLSQGNSPRDMMEILCMHGSSPICLSSANRTTAKFALFNVGQGYMGLLLQTVSALVALLGQLTLLEQNQFLVQMRSGGLASIVDNTVRHWMPVAVAQDTFFRLATVNDNLLSYPVVHSEFPSTPLSNEANDLAKIIFKPSVRYSYGDNPSSPTAANSAVQIFSKIGGADHPSQSNSAVDIGGNTDGSTPMTSTMPSPVQSESKKKKEEKRIKKMLKEAREGLLAGWQVAYDSNYNKPYYCNPSTAESRWDKPS